MSFIANQNDTKADKVESQYLFIQAPYNPHCYSCFFTYWYVSICDVTKTVSRVTSFHIIIKVMLAHFLLTAKRAT